MSDPNQAINKADLLASYFHIYEDPDVPVEEVRDPESWRDLTKGSWERYEKLTEERRIGLICGMHHLDSLDRNLTDEEIMERVVPVLYKMFWPTYSDEENEECISGLEREKWVLGVRRIWDISDRIG